MSVIDTIKIQFSNLKLKFNELIEKIKNWPDYIKIGAGMIAAGLFLFIIGVILY